MKRLVAATSGAIALTLVTPASAGNGETYYLGSRAALLAGAVTAETDGASALWYNPARLSSGGTEAVDLSVSAYLIRFGGTPDLETRSAELRAEKSDQFVLQAVPTAAAYKQRLWGWDFGYGLFVPNLTFSYPRSQASTQPAVSPSSTIAVESTYELTEYYGGIGVGRKLAPGLSLGFSVFGYYGEENASQSSGLTSGDLFAMQTQNSERDSIGLQLVSGLHYRATRRLSFGFVLRSPVYSLVSWTEESVFGAAGDAMSGQGSIRFSDSNRLSVRRSNVLAAPRAALGVALVVAPHTVAEIDLKVRGTLTTDGARLQNPTTDVRAGLRTQASANVWLGGGLFTDRSATPADISRTSSSLDFYGGSLGAEFGTPYRTLDQDRQRGRMALSFAVSLSYAVGLGKIGNLGVESQGGQLSLEPRVDSAVAHEFVLTISSGLSQFLGR